jgi:hypothetical protein
VRISTRALIKGNFDYIWGGGNLFFEQCEIRTIARGISHSMSPPRGPRHSARHKAASLPWAEPWWHLHCQRHVVCELYVHRRSPASAPSRLAGSNGTAGNNVSWYGCEFRHELHQRPSATLFSGNYVFWQAENTQNAAPVSFANVTTITGADPELQAATNIVTWFNGWTPVLPVTTPNAPVISAPTVLPDGNFQLNATGDNGQNYRVWATEDITLTPVISTWTLLTNGTFGASPVIITDLDATNHVQRFYLITIP